MNWIPRDWLLAFILLAATFLAYEPAWNGKPVWDDDAHMTKPELRSMHGLARIWIEPGATQQYYPLAHSFFWAEHKLWEDAPLPYHLVNILLHALSALLVAGIFRRLSVPGAWLAAFIFALHPVQVESVAWISELKNTLSGLFCLAALRIYLAFDASRDRRLYVAALALFLLGLMSKTTVATLPAVLLVIFWWKRGVLAWKRDALPLTPFFAVGIGAGLFTAWVERHYIGANGADFNFSLIERFLIAGRAFWFYLGKLFWPANLIFIYPRWHVSQTVWWQYLFLLAALALFASATWCAISRRQRSLLAGLLCFGGALFPALGFVNVYPFIYSFVADHFQYLASLGIIALFSAVAARFAAHWKPWGRWVSSGMLLASLSILTWFQAASYTDAVTLYKTTLDRNPDCWLAYNNLAILLQENGHQDAAFFNFKKALELWPGSVKTHDNFGAALLEAGRVTEAINQFQAALEIDPNFSLAHTNLGSAMAQKGEVAEAIAQFQKAIEIQPDLTEAHGNLGRLLAKIGKNAEAIRNFNQALALRPEDPKLHSDLGRCLAQSGRIDEALVEYRKCVALQPDNARWRDDLGVALARSRRADEGLVDLEKAVELDPRSPGTHNNLGIVLTETGRIPEAILQFQAALAVRPDYPEAINNLGKSLFEQGRIEEAISQFQKAIKLMPGDVQAHANLGMALDREHRNSEAIAELRQACGLDPGNPARHDGLGVALANGGDLEQAIAEFQQALAITPDNPKVHEDMAKALLQSGRVVEAVGHYRSALRADRPNPAVLNDLAWVLATNPAATVRDGSQALTLAGQANAVAGGKDPAILDTLAAAYAETGRFPEAVETAREGLKLASIQKNPALAGEIGKRLALYQAGSPYRDPVSPSSVHQPSK